MIAHQERFNHAISLFDAANAEDPNQDDGQPKELLYARRMTEMLGRVLGKHIVRTAPSRVGRAHLIHQLRFQFHQPFGERCCAAVDE